VSAKNERSGEAGFTLIEVLIAGLLTAALLAALYGAFFSLTSAKERADEEVSRAREARRFVDIFNMEVEAAFFTKDDARTFFRSGASEAGAPWIEFTFFSYPLLRGGRPAGDLKRARYYFNPERGVLYREAGDPLGATAGAFAVEAITGVSEIKLGFFDGVAWQPAWDASSAGFLPLAVKVQAALKDAKPFSATAVPRIG
jgi:type II secretion system protein J